MGRNKKRIRNRWERDVLEGIGFKLCNIVWYFAKGKAQVKGGDKAGSLGHTNMLANSAVAVVIFCTKQTHI